jgi:hypothetical protein
VFESGQVVGTVPEPWQEVGTVPEPAVHPQGLRDMCLPHSGDRIGLIVDSPGKMESSVQRNMGLSAGAVLETTRTPSSPPACGRHMVRALAGANRLGPVPTSAGPEPVPKNLQAAPNRPGPVPKNLQAAPNRLGPVPKDLLLQGK